MDRARASATSRVNAAILEDMSQGTTSVGPIDGDFFLSEPTLVGDTCRGLKPALENQIGALTHDRSRALTHVLRKREILGSS